MCPIVADENYNQMLDVVDMPGDPSQMPESIKGYFHVSSIQAQMNFLLGNVLTIVDSSISDLIQRKAMKDLVRSTFWDRMNFIRDLVYDRNSGVQSAGPKSKKKPN